MTSIVIQLPDELAREATSAGLLTADNVAAWLRQRLLARQADNFAEALAALAAVTDPGEMSPEEVAREIRAMRAERRTANGR